MIKKYFKHTNIEIPHRELKINFVNKKCEKCGFEAKYEFTKCPICMS